MSSLRGIDVSGWQKVEDWKNLNPDFIMIKASEGVNYKSDGLDIHYNAWSGKTDGSPSDKLYGFYHYARPETGNSAVDEAESFLSFVGHHAGHCLFALDVEGAALSHSRIVEWSKNFLDKVASKTGSTPLLYTNASTTRDLNWESVAIEFPLWVAHYDVNKPYIGSWPSWTMWQYTNSPLDKDIFEGDREYWMGLARGKNINRKSWVITSQTPTHIVLDYK